MEKNKILIIDDSFPILTSLKGILESHDYEVTTTVNGLDALNRLNNEHFDIVISDIQMPNMSGLELLERIHKTINEDLPVILMTGEDKEEFAIKAIRLGAVDYVKKPFEIDHLLRSISSQIAKASEDKRGLAFLSYTEHFKVKLHFTTEDYLKNKIISHVNQVFNLGIRFTPGIKNGLLVCIDEMVSNAFIHGILRAGHKREKGVDFRKELRKIVEEENLYDEKVSMEIEIISKQKKIVISVVHDGEGFDFKKNRAADDDYKLGVKSTGRGMFILKNLVDNFYYELDGRKVVIEKKYED